MFSFNDCVNDYTKKGISIWDKEFDAYTDILNNLLFPYLSWPYLLSFCLSKKGMFYISIVVIINNNITFLYTHLRI